MKSAIKHSNQQVHWSTGKKKTGIGVWKINPTTGEHTWDKSIFALYGLKLVPKIANAEWENLPTPESKKLIHDEFKMIVQGAQELNNTFEIKTPSGERKFIGSWGKVMRNELNRLVLFYGINWDRTSSIEMEKQLEQEKAKEKEKAKAKAKAFLNAKLASIGQLAAGVGLEINNPLAIISDQIFNTQQIVMMPENPDSKLLGRFKKIDVCVERIRNIVKGLRTIARSDDNLFNDFDPLDFLSETYELLKDIYEKEEVGIIVSGKKMKTLMTGNKGGLVQIMMNLITNAKDSTQGQGDRKIEIHTDYNDSDILISIKDNGRGIPAQIQEKILEPFFTTKEVKKDTGIGLPLITTIVKEHSGHIELKYQVGEGSTFTLIFPMKKPEKETMSNDIAPVNTVTEQKTLFPIHVLIVDDEEDLRDILKFMLSKVCSKVTVAKDVREAMVFVNEHDFDIILSDVKMPEIDGFEFLRMLRGKVEINQPKFIFITGGVDIDEATQKIIETDSNGFLSKPFKNEQIKNKISSVFEELKMDKFSHDQG